MSFFEDQEDAWFDGGMEWYCKANQITPEACEGIPADFDPYEFWAEVSDNDE